MTGSEQAFEDRLRAALAEPMTAQQIAALDALRPTAERAPVMRLLRGRTVRRSLLLVAAVAIALPLAALGGVFTTEDPYGLADPSEFQAELDAAMAAVPLPAGRTWPDLPSLHAHQPGVGAYSRGGARGTVELIAVCVWLDELVDASAAQDAPRAAAAAAEIGRIPSWPSWNSVFWDQSVRDGLRPIIDSVAAGRVDAAQAEVSSANCSWLAGQP